MELSSNGIIFVSKISIIIPVYNLEDCITRSLDSAINQTLHDIEIICINDGSTDNSLKIIEKYAQNDTRIKIINQKNQGVSVARNAGILNSNSEYILFLDGDDTIDLTCCEKSYNEIQKYNYDILAFGMDEICNGNIKPLYFNKYLNSSNPKDKEKLYKSLLDQATGKLIKTSFLKENNIYFPPYIKMGEDGIFCLKLLKYKPSWGSINTTLYNYYRQNNSATNNDKKVVAEQILATKYFINTDEYKTADTEYKVMALNRMLGGILFFLENPEKLKYRYQYIFQIAKFKKYLFTLENINILEQCRHIDMFKKHSPISLLFSVKNEKYKGIKRKIITILGLTFCIKEEQKCLK